MARAPTIKRGPASHYASAGETIVEVWSAKLRAGCLLSVRETAAGTLVVEAYRGDAPVRVRVARRDFRITR